MKEGLQNFLAMHFLRKHGSGLKNIAEDLYNLSDGYWDFNPKSFQLKINMNFLWNLKKVLIIIKRSLEWNFKSVKTKKH